MSSVPCQNASTLLLYPQPKLNTLHTVKQVWLRLLLKELGYSQPGPTILSCDKNSAILLANNPEFHARTKYIDTQVHWIREIVKAGQIILKWILGTEQVADRLTKPLDRILFQGFVSRAAMKKEQGSLS